MATKKIRKRTRYDLMNRCSLAQVAEQIEAEKGRKQRLEWYLQEVMLEKETLMNECAKMSWPSRCVTVPDLSSQLPTCQATFNKPSAPIPLNTTPLLNTVPAPRLQPQPSPTRDASPITLSPCSSGPASPASTLTSPLSTAWEGDWRHDPSSDSGLWFSTTSSDSDSDITAEEQQALWVQTELWWQDAASLPFAEDFALPVVTDYGQYLLPCNQ
jgi:hypothetical protein